MSPRRASQGIEANLCVLRGGGDVATGVAWRLTRAGFPVVVTELGRPLTVRRTVALSSAVADGVIDVEGMIGRLVEDHEEALDVASRGDVAVLVSPRLPLVNAEVVIDARLAKRNIDTSSADAPFVVALGPGFTANVDCDVVVETNRGPRLGRVLWEGSAEPNTGTPGVVTGRSVERVLRAPHSGVVRWVVAIGDQVSEGQVVGSIDASPVVAPFVGVVRGLVAEGTEVSPKLKVGDLDPRLDVNCDEISDKALAIGGGVLEAILSWQRTQEATS